ncbi:MAG: phenylacetate--CoA ligase, partial [Deltaproteobacteria bacterium]|nr:phenylacetate--CoA ligase [Deltaproteobacteria bacterium]
MILDIGFDTMPREDIEAIILRRLKTTIDRVYTNVPFYRKKFEESNLTSNDIQ